MKISKVEFWWIRFWYNDITRILGVLLGGFTALIYIALYYIEPMLLNRIVVEIIYIVIMGCSILDNDYSKLRKTGLDEYRRKL